MRSNRSFSFCESPHARSQLKACACFWVSSFGHGASRACHERRSERGAPHPPCSWSRAMRGSQCTRSECAKMLRLCWSAHWSCMLFTTHCTRNAHSWVPATSGSGLLQEVIQVHSLLTMNALWQADMYRIEQGSLFWPQKAPEFRQPKPVLTGPREVAQKRWVRSKKCRWKSRVAHPVRLTYLDLRFVHILGLRIVRHVSCESR